jgi:hypothetical protein
MDRLTAIPLRIGAWCVDPKSGQMSRDGEIVRVEARTLRLLLCLAERAGEVVSIDDLLNRMVATVTPWVDAEPLVVPGRPMGQPGRRMLGSWSWRTVVVAVCAVLAAVLLFNGERNAHPPTVAAVPGRSVAVLPFLDLTTQAQRR